MQCKLNNLQTDKQTRLFFVDLLESLAIFLVLSYHGTNYSYDFLQDSNNVPFFFRYFFRTILSCCVPLFFFANGFLLLNRQFNLKKHILKIIRLVILTGVWGILDLFFLMFIRKEFLSVKDFLIGVWTWKQGWINHLWYIQALVVIYFLFPLIKIVYDNRRDIFAFFTVSAAIFTFGNVAINILASIAVHLVLGKNVAYSFNWFNGFNPFRGIYGYSFVYFCIGGIAYDILNTFKLLKRKWVCIVTILVSMFGLFVVGITLSRIKEQLWDVVWNGYDTLFTFINVVCIFSLCSYYRGTDNLLRKTVFTISSNTLGIYFIHVLFNQLLKPHVVKISFMSNIPGNMLYTVIILIVSLGTVLIIRKIPVLKRLVI